MNDMTNLAKKIDALANPAKAKLLRGYFKTGPGEYGEGDIFIGLTVPMERKIARENRSADFAELEKLLASPVHEHRSVALFVLSLRFERGDAAERRKIYMLYLKNRKYINNWDLVDLSAPYIVGEYLKDKDSAVLFRLAKAKRIWDRRIAMLACFAFIRRGSFEVPLRVVEMLVHDEHDLMHKAVGWMLREIGKRSLKTEEEFLKKYYRTMPRTMLRYAIEKFPEEKRRQYMKK